MPLAWDCRQSKQVLLRCDFIGCYACLYEGRPADIRYWADNGDTPLCPQCGLDFVLGFAGELDRELLIEYCKAQFPQHWQDAP